MPIQVACSSCGGQFLAADQSAGASVVCTDCGVPIPVPYPAQVQAPIQVQPTAQAPFAVPTGVQPQFPMQQPTGGSPFATPQMQAPPPPGYAPVAYAHSKPEINGPPPVVGFLIALAGIPFFIAAIMLNASVLVVLGTLATFFCAGTALATVWKGHHVAVGIGLGLISPLGLLILSFFPDRRKSPEYQGGAVSATLAGIIGGVAPGVLMFIGSMVASLAGGSTRDPSLDPVATYDQPADPTPQRNSRTTEPTRPSVTTKRQPNTTAPTRPSLDAKSQPKPVSSDTYSKNDFFWRVKIDGQAASPKYPDDYKLSVELPPRTQDRSIRFAKGLSPFFVFGSLHGSRGGMTVVNARTQQVVGRVSGFNYFSSNHVLDPSGKYVGFANGRSKGLLVWDVTADKIAKKLTLETSNNKYIGFSRSGSVLGIGGGFGPPLVVWSLPSGTASHSLVITKHLEIASMTISGGGRYAAFCETVYKPGIRVYDLQTGKLAGSLSTKIGRSNARCTALAFSPDGKELAGLFNTAFGDSILCWDVVTGKRILEHQFVKRMRIRLGIMHPEPLQWLPNRKRWLLYGQELFDRAAKRIVFSLPNDRKQRPIRKVLSDRYVTTLAGTSRQYTMTSLKLDEARIAAQKK